MIGRKHRFHGRNSLRVVYAKGETIRNNYCALKVLPTRPGKPYRVAVVVSKKVSKSAVVRNRIRRRIYEVVRTATNDTFNVDVVITVFSEQLAAMPINELEKQLQEMLAQVDNTTRPQSKQE